MEIYPAIDLMGGRCVRLTEGDFDARTDYGDDPVAVARAYADAGATWLHLVDLDGARDPEKRQWRAIIDIVAATGLSVQTGGGIRTFDDAVALKHAGASRIVVGSLCVKDPDLTKNILRQRGREQVVLALDVRGDFDKGFFVATSGWKDTSAVRVEEILELYADYAVHILCTDIAKDGRLAGPNVDLYRYLAKAAPRMRFIASGGVAGLDDLDALQEAGAAGVVIGKALYEKKFTLQDALRRVA